MVEDYIKRSDALKFSVSIVGKLFSEEFDIKQEIQKIPSADVAPIKRGKWVNGKCSECGGDAPYSPMRSTYYRSLFCPNCGADMRKDGV